MSVLLKIALRLGAFASELLLLFPFNRRPDLQLQPTDLSAGKHIEEISISRFSSLKRIAK
jgi:hypothetical protein